MHGASRLHIRIATSSDCLPLANLRTGLWPESPCDEHTVILDGTGQRVLPLIIFVAEQSDGALAGNTHFPRTE
jgi:hypothetical protein